MESQPRIPYGRQHITPQDIEAVTRVLQSDFLTQGPEIAPFEQAFAQYIGSKYAVAVANGTAALHLCAMAMNVAPGQKVITSPLTFAASANCIRYCGGEVVFADIDPETWLLDAGHVRALLAEAPNGTYSGIIPVDFAGLPVNMAAFRQLADQYGLWLIEDACHAPGAEWLDPKRKWQRSGNGNYAELAIFSLHPVKHIAAGEGGVITTNDEALYKRLQVLRTHGITRDADLLSQPAPGGWYYEMVELGYNYRLTDMQAALAHSQLQRADEGLERRREIAHRYNAAFAGTAVLPPPQMENRQHAFHLYVVQVPDRKGLYDYLREQGIFAQVHYIPAHTLPYYKQQGWKEGSLPYAEKYYEGCLSLPMYPTLTPEQQDYVIQHVLQFVQG